MDVISKLARNFERYLTLERVHPTATYNYKARDMYGLPVFDCTLHKPKCSGGSWTYIAVPAGADLLRLRDDERLYVGCQTMDRMFRGDGMGGKNFHHAQIRAGNGADNAEAFLRAGKRIDIYQLDCTRLGPVLASDADLAVLRELAQHPAKHAGYWVEQFILYTQPGKWR